MKYTYRCNTHSEFDIEEPMDAKHEEAVCWCGATAPRVYQPTPHTWEPYSNPNHPERRGVEG